MEEKSTIVFNVKSNKPTTTPSENFRITRGGSFSKRERPPRKPRVISEEKFKEMAAKYSEVCIHDYGDEYHMSEEERTQKNRYYEVFSKIIKCKKKYRKIDEFVRTYRLCLDCLKEVAENNGVYAPEKFMKLVLKGEIEVFGLTFPKYIGKDKKSINWSYISKFILGDEDPKKLSINKDDEYRDMSDDEAFEMLFTEEERAKLMESMREFVENHDDSITPYYGEDDKHGKVHETLAVSASKKETKHFINDAPELVRVVRETEKERRKSLASAHRLHQYSFEMTHDDYREIEAMDKARGLISESDVPEFKGDIMNKRDYRRYLYRLHQYEMENIKDNYNGKMRTLEDIQEMELKEALEKAGWNLRALYKQKDKDKKLKKAYKEDKKREEDLKKKLLALQKRQEKRGKKSGIELNSKKKKKKEKKEKEDD